ncbi:histidinol-phosphate transaminase [Aliidongia sp.]|uniref:histidinol-phosphate transaminase n=1 Tax=Aliidongia sp. TaxID=1914230 RepID=UPI0039C854A7
MLQPVARPGVLDIAPYVGGESKVPGVNRVIRLASNEGALGPSPKAIEAYKALAGEIHRYPDGGAAELRATLATRFGLEAERIVCSGGSDELITMLVRAYAGAGDEVLYSQHGFLMYPIAAKAVGATPVTAPETDLTTDVDALLAAVTERTRLVFVANPNNPTGTYIPAAEMARLHAGLPSHVVLVIDAAYAEFVGQHDYEPGIELVRRTTNTVMIRTFSKIYALGGMRVGWAYCPDNIADVLNRIRNPFNVNAAGQAAAVASLEDVEFAERSRAHNDKWLPWTSAALTRLGLKLTPSVGNFLLAEFPEAAGHDADAAWEYMKSRGILVRKMGGYGLPNALRITIGTGDEMKAVVDALSLFLGKS